MRIIIIHPRVEVRIPASMRFLFLAAIWFGGFFFASRATGTPDSTFTELERVPVHTTDRGEPPEDRKKRLRELADAIDAVTSSADERAWLIMTARFESGLARYVTEDGERCKLGQGGHCDNGRAFGAWQIHRMARTENKTEQATTALRLFRAAAIRCSRTGQEYWLGGISGYARGFACTWGPAAKRLETMRAIRGRL